MRIITFTSALVCVLSAPLAGQDNTQLLDRMKAMEDRIASLETELKTLRSQPPAAPPFPAPAPQAAPGPAAVLPAEQPTPQEAVTLGGAGGSAAKALNPDISVIGDFLGAVGKSGNRFTPGLEMHESEVSFQEVIDPYARADFFISFGEQGVNLEEGYLTFTSLPAGLLLKVGKMRAAFGKVNTLHNHVLPWTDRPLVMQNIVGGEDGIDDAGLSLSRILPAPKGIFLEATAQLFRGDSTNVFQSTRRRDVSTVEHLRAYHDFSDSTNLDLGGSYALGHSPYGEGSNRLIGIDATLRWKPLQRSIYHSFLGRSELVWARTNFLPSVVSPGLEAVLPATRATAKPFGFYVSADYQLNRRWFLGGRFDRSQRGTCLPTEPATSTPCVLSRDAVALPFNNRLVQDTGGSFVVTYWPSEFSQIRAQLRRNRYGEGFTANEVLFQFQFAMGAHGAHPF